MWLEISVAALVLLQTVTICLLWLQGRRVKRGFADKKGEAGNVPSLMIVNALNKIEHRLSVLEERTQKPQVQARLTEASVAPMTASRSVSHHLSASNYELAQHLAREGCDAEQLIERCGLSRNEAELVLRLYAKRA
ncbi:DUF2802 domain-containing protein [Dyella caseinilytica]|uniref:DUF2802 domain-containing protein n=1 Tax=Dyella caseinilytica TaxID=1849581 RepID=A0ABX7GTK0_9GAMM|nr:DUF2802 domain-containing protein [Dyella caseinilytica]QRN53383.1 DUF2802 domain-containing protein [Dyella caseinilytica]GFZ86080.1 hypothetical protein GCM10011408_00490 [Dyella caseinilytica]